MEGIPINCRPLRKTPTIERADQGSEDRAAPAEETRAAKHDGSDAVQVRGLPCLRIADAGCGLPVSRPAIP